MQHRCLPTYWCSFSDRQPALLSSDPPPLPPQLAVAMLSVNGRFLGTEVRPRKWK